MGDELTAASGPFYSSSGMRTVLIIDDHAATLETSSAILRAFGFDTAVASSGGEGIILATARVFDVLLIDLRLPDMSGIDVVRQLKRSGVTGRMVIVTAFPTLDSSFDAGAAGADGYVDGPLLGEDVVDVVSEALKGPLPVQSLAADLDLSSGGMRLAASTRSISVFGRSCDRSTKILADRGPSTSSQLESSSANLGYVTYSTNACTCRSLSTSCNGGFKRLRNVWLPHPRMSDRSHIASGSTRFRYGTSVELFVHDSGYPRLSIERAIVEHA